MHLNLQQKTITTMLWRPGGAVSPSCGFHLQGLTQELWKDAGESDDAFAAVF